MESENKINFNDVIFADLHLHSKYSRATSSNLSFENLVKWARVKGLNLLGTGDFTHPLWFEEIKKLVDRGNGFYYYTGNQRFPVSQTSNISPEVQDKGFPFIITGEISLMYTQGRGRRIHLVVLVPSIEIAEKINSYFDTKGRRDYDGRPIFNISGEQFVKDMMKISEDIEIIPAHCMTPWFGLFGSNSGFDSLKECFGSESEKIYAIESGMSADPEMLWRLDEKINIVSFSDSHSFWPWRLGREATIFDIPELTYENIIKAIRTSIGLVGTVETPPEYGKYHWDGHRLCKFSSPPEETKKLGGICPVCGKLLTIGVDSRVEEIAKFSVGHKSERAKMFYKLVPLHELISLNIGVAMASKKVWDVYNSLIRKFENEFNILLKISKEDLIKEKVDDKLIELILKNRVGKIKVKPGFDGEYGKIELEEKQKSLF